MKAGGITVEAGGVVAKETTTATSALEAHSTSGSFTGNVVYMHTTKAAGTDFHIWKVRNKACFSLHLLNVI